MLRGNTPARIDDKGRLKVPSAFRAFIEEPYGNELFVTSVRGECVRIYPMPVWAEIERKVAAAHEPALGRFFKRANYHGQVAQMDQQGRVLIQPRLRDSAQMNGEVDVLGLSDHLEVWNHDRKVEQLESEPFTDADDDVLMRHGI